MGLAVRGVRRILGPDQDVEFIESSNGVDGIARAWRDRPDVVVADEIASRAGAFALAKDLTGAEPPFEGRIVILLDRSQDRWLARWSGADAWFTKPVNPFELADTVAGFLAATEKETA